MATLLPLLKKELSLLAQLGRLRMTIFSAVTYSTTFSMALHYEFGSKLDSIPFQTGQFLFGWAFILLCQLSAHFLGEYYDFKADVLNGNASPFTGGSRVLVNGGYSPQRCLFLGWFACLSSFLILQFQLPNTVHLVGYFMIFLACQYSGAPFRFSHHALGELTAAVVMNILLPYFAAVLANDSFYASFDSRLAMLIIPSALLKFALFIVLNMADRRADWLGGKTTLPVLLGDQTSARLYTFLVASGYASIPIIYALDPNNSVATLSTALLMLSTAYPVVPLCKSLLNNRPYYITGLVRQCLQHSPLPVLAVYLDCLGKELLVSDSPLVHLVSIGFQVRCLPVYPYLYMLLKKPPPQQPPAAPQSPKLPILISGAGIAGLTLATTLFKLKIPYIILEKKSKSNVEDGADLAFWPSSIKILKELGIENKLWDNSIPISKVNLAKSATDILNTVNMDNVTMGTGEQFRLVCRQDLMSSLSKMQENSENILYNCKITKIQENSDSVQVFYTGEDGTEKNIMGHILVGADGVHSVSRAFITDNSDKPRYSGEICLRGSTSSPHLANLAEAPNTMTIWYGNGYRASWGLTSPYKSYWWVKVKAQDEKSAKDIVSRLPSPINTFAANSNYIHPIIDRMSISRWCSSRCVLIGDAAHPVTPNMAQGANMAIEDAFFLGICLKKYYFQDGFQEAFYEYFHKRWPYTSKIAQESYQQSRMGQWTNVVMVRLREMLLRRVPARVLEKKMRNVNLCDVKSWMDEFTMLTKKE